uniref:Prefoldin subunit 5 n=1 Tax=Lygus hesperus TaxID=30085 RepID=A0A0A9ZEP8_LYGHE
MTTKQSASPSQVVNLDTYKPQELKELHNNLTQELQLLMNNLNTMKLALNKYKASKEALTILDSQKDEEKETLVPLTSSLYIPGKISHINSVLVDIGTGYFAEKTIPSSLKFLDERIDHVVKNVQTIQNAVNDKREDITKVRAALQRSISMYAANTQVAAE